MKKIPFSKRLFFSLCVVLLNALLYMLVGRYQIFPMVQIEPVWIDGAVPYLPWTSLIYISYYLILFLPLWLCEDEFVFFQMVRAYLGAIVICIAIFIFLPVRFSWHHSDYRDFFTTYIMLPIRKADNQGTNSFPSEHVAMALIGALVFLRYHFWKKGGLLLGWAILICISTLTAKQHYFIDVAVSVFLAFAVVFLLGKPQATTQTTEGSPVPQE